MKCVSLFSGAGGLDIGTVQAGVEILACVENDPDSAATLRLNQLCTDATIIEQDIRDIDFKEWRSSEPLIVTGGPPCQPFSKNGYWVRNANRLIDSDPRNMLGQFIRAIMELEPSGFLFENVESILHPTNRPTFDRFLNELRVLGFQCSVCLANSARFGVPQKRKRVFVFGIRNARHDIPAPQETHGSTRQMRLFDQVRPFAGVGDHISPYATPEFYEPEEETCRGTYYYELTNVPPGKNYMALSSLKNYSGRTFRHGSRFWNFLQKLHPDQPSITIAAQPGPWVGPFHWTNRRLRVPEAAAIQTFPHNYQFHGSRRSIQRQIGNAVPCLLGKYMVSHLLKHL